MAIFTGFTFTKPCKGKAPVTLVLIAVVLLGVLAVSAVVAPQVTPNREQSAGASSSLARIATDVDGERLSQPYAIVKSSNGTAAQVTIEIDGQPTRYLRIIDELVTIALDELAPETTITVIVESDTPGGTTGCELGTSQIIWAAQTSATAATCTTTIP